MPTGFRLVCCDFNPFPPNVTFLYPVKNQKTLWFSDTFRGYKNVTVGKNGLIISIFSPIKF